MIGPGVCWLAGHQNPDGGWGDTVKSVSNISTTMLGRAAIHLAGATGRHAETLRRADGYMNERFGTNFTQADQLFFDQIQEEAIESEMLKKAAAANSKDDFRYVFEKAFEGLVIDRMADYLRRIDYPVPPYA